MFENKRKISKLLLRACKLSVGSSLAIYIARFLNLEEFLNCKRRFVENLDEVKLKKYWNS